MQPMEGIAKKKGHRFHASLGEEIGFEVMEQDAEKIRQVTPGFHIAPRVLPLNEKEGSMHEAKPIFHLPLGPAQKKKEREE
jgi:hypothetical protein